MLVGLLTLRLGIMQMQRRPGNDAAAAFAGAGSSREANNCLIAPLTGIPSEVWVLSFKNITKLTLRPSTFTQSKAVLQCFRVNAFPHLCRI
jgi:hypothetical protein